MNADINNIALPEDVTAAVNVLKNGGTILYPTDTIWGIGCDAANADAVAAVYKLKQRSPSKSLIILVADLEMLARYVGEEESAATVKITLAERPTTVIYPSAVGLAPGVAASDGSVGIRITNHPFCQALTRALGRAIVSTSANISGKTHGVGLDAIESEIQTGVDYIVNKRHDISNGQTASRIVRLHPNGGIEILRE